MKKLLYLFLFIALSVGAFAQDPELVSKANAGDAYAQYRLGQQYHYGFGVDKNYSKAVELYTLAANQGNELARDEINKIAEYKELLEKANAGDAYAQDDLSECYCFGYGVAEEDTVVARQWKEKALKGYYKLAKEGNSDAIEKLSDYYGNPFGLHYLVTTSEWTNISEKNAKEGDQWRKKTIAIYTKLAKKGDADAQYKLYQLTEEAPWLKKAIAGYKKLAKKGDAKAQYYLGLNTDTDYDFYSDRVMKLFTQSANQGFTDAQIELGRFYEGGEGERDPDYKQSNYWFAEAAAQGNGRALFKLAQHYEKGYGVEQNIYTAQKYYNMAAGQDPKYRYAQSDFVDLAKVAYFLSKAEAGDVEAQYFVGNYYHTRVWDYEKAKYWYKKAAEQGLVQAQYQLGLCYRLGDVEEDYEKAKYWLKKAADQGLQEAKEALKEIINNGY